MEFLAINLNDFHENQNDARTTAEIVFVQAKDIENAKKYMKMNFPESEWALVCKQVFDEKIVTKNVYLCL